MDFLRSLFPSQPAGSLPDTRSYLPSQQEDIVDSGAVELADTKLRIMGTGACTYLFAAGEVRVQCPCPQGVFNIQSNTIQDNEKCQKCTHYLFLHQDFTPTLGQNSLP
jgi:hypothetical protein